MARAIKIPSKVVTTGIPIQVLLLRANDLLFGAAWGANLLPSLHGENDNGQRHHPRDDGEKTHRFHILHGPHWVNAGSKDAPSEIIAIAASRLSTTSNGRARRRPGVLDGETF